MSASSSAGRQAQLARCSGSAWGGARRAGLGASGGGGSWAAVLRREAASVVAGWTLTAVCRTAAFSQRACALPTREPSAHLLACKRHRWLWCLQSS